jgi:hypothetical protein
MKENSRVFVVTAEELRSQGTGYGSATELTFEGKQFKRVLSLRKLFHKVAIDYCERESKAGRLCLLVEEADLYTVWQTEPLLQPINSRLPGLPTQLSDSSISSQQDRVNQTRASQTKNIGFASPQSFSPIKSSTNIEPWFIERCQQALAYQVGAIAKIYIQETLDKFPQITYHRLINELAAKIPDPQQAEEFWQQVLTLITAPAKQKYLQSQRNQPLLNQPSLKQLPAQKTSNLQKDSSGRIYRGVKY